MSKPILIKARESVVELVLTDDGANNVFEKRRRWGGEKIVTRMKRYDVMLDGKKIGEVYQDRATFERKTPGRTYVNSRWTNVRWFYDLEKDPAFRTKYGERRSTDNETRQRAVEGLLWLRTLRLEQAAEMAPDQEFADA